METRKNKGEPKPMTMSQALGVLEYGIKWGCGRKKVKTKLTFTIVNLILSGNQEYMEK